MDEYSSSQKLDAYVFAVNMMNTGVITFCFNKASFAVRLGMTVCSSYWGIREAESESRPVRLDSYLSLMA